MKTCHLLRSIKKIEKKGMIKNSIFKFLFNVFEASNLVTSICEEHEKIAHKENILVKNKIFSLY